MTTNENTTQAATPSAFFQNFIEVNKKRRGHDFIGPEIHSAPDFYDCEEIPTEDQTVVAHYFTSNSDWWIVETRKEDGLIYCYCLLNGWTDCAEWGYSDLTEMERMITEDGSVVERDLHWTPKKFSEIKIGE